VSPSASVSPSSSPSVGYKNYTRGNYNTLPANDADLETSYSVGDISDVSSKNDIRVAQLASNEYAIHQFKDHTSVANSAGLEWEGQSDLSCAVSTVYLQIYNRNSSTWETVDSNNSTAANTDFSLIANIVDLTNYKDINTVICCRVYQEAT